MKIETKFKTLVDANGNYRVIDYATSNGVNKPYKCSAPKLMGMKITLNGLKNCHPQVDFDGLELITIKLKK